MGFGPTTGACRRSLGVMLLLVLAPFVPVLPGSSVYEGVGRASGRRLLARAGSGPVRTAGGELYLLRQETWHGVLLTTFVRFVEWTDAEVEEARRTHRGAVDGGGRDG